jgi:hypothetical protein
MNNAEVSLINLTDSRDLGTSGELGRALIEHGYRTLAHHISYLWKSVAFVLIVDFSRQDSIRRTVKRFSHAFIAEVCYSNVMLFHPLITR